MMCLNECITDDARVLLVGKKRFQLFPRNIELKIYRKNFNHAEFIGEELCAMKSISCVHFFLVSDGLFSSNQMTTYRLLKHGPYQIQIGSYDFKKNNCEYFSIYHGEISFDDDHLLPLLDMTPNEKNQKELLDELLDMFALDTYMGQIDRFHRNIVFERNLETKEIHLCPLFDFEYSLKSSYLDPYSIYLNPIYPFFTLKDYRNLIHIFPEFRNKLESYLDVRLVNTAVSAYAAKGLKMPSSKLPFYQDFEKRQKRLIRKIIE